MSVVVQRCPLFKLASISKSSGSELAPIPSGVNYGDYLYWSQGSWQVGGNRISLGAFAGSQGQNPYGVAVGAYAGQYFQSQYAIALGTLAGNNMQQANAIAIGENSGHDNQQTNAIAIGPDAGHDAQQANAIAIGDYAGQTHQQTYAIAIGTNAGANNQQQSAIAIGTNAGAETQGQFAIAIGQNVAPANQGQNSIAIGQNIGQGITGQVDNSIVLNVTATNLDAGTTGFFVNPIRGPYSSTNVLCYNTATNEIYFNGSSRRFKHNIVPLQEDTSTIYNLVPREFDYNLNGEHDIGFIAEEANEVHPMFAYRDKDGIPEGIQWNTITTCLIAEIQKLKEEIDKICSKE